MRVLVVGAGMYVTGRRGSGQGTVLASLAQASRELSLDQVDVLARDPANAEYVAAATREINGRLGAGFNARYVYEVGLEEHLAAGRQYDAAIVAVPDRDHYS